MLALIADCEILYGTLFKYVMYWFKWYLCFYEHCITLIIISNFIYTIITLLNHAHYYKERYLHIKCVEITIIFILSFLV